MAGRFSICDSNNDLIYDKIKKYLLLTENSIILIWRI